MTEEGSTLDLPLDSFYKEYIKAHYRAMGDLRNNQIIQSKSYYMAFMIRNSDDYSRNMNIKNPYLLQAIANISTSITNAYNSLSFYSFRNDNILFKDAFEQDNSLQNKPTQDIKLKNINLEL